MKVVVAIVVVIAVVLLLGWVTISRDGGQPDVTVNTDVIEEDTEKAVQATKDAANTVEEAVEKGVEEVKKTDVDVDVKRDETP